MTEKVLRPGRLGGAAKQKPPHCAMRMAHHDSYEECQWVGSGSTPLGVIASRPFG